MGLNSFFTAFLFIFLTELGDKTQLAVITLSSKYGWRSVISGAMLAFALIDGLSILAGKSISEAIPSFWIQITGGIIFIAFGLYLLLRKEAKNERLKISGKASAFVSALIFVSLTELGDKTQLAVIVLAAEYAETILIFLGVILAFLTITIIGVLIGKGIVRLVPHEHLRLISALLFICFGLVFFLQAVVFT